MSDFPDAPGSAPRPAAGGGGPDAAAAHLSSAVGLAGLGLWEYDPAADVTHMDDRCLRAFGFRPEDDPVPSEAVLARVHPDDRGAARDRVRAALEARGDLPYEAEYRVVRPDGSARHVAVRGHAVAAGDGPARRVTRVFGTLLDVTDRREAEARLARVAAEADRRTRLYEAVLASTPDLAYVFDLGHRFVYANEGLLRMWGRTWAEAAGKTCLELGYEPWHAAMHDREIEQVKATGRPVRGEVPFTGTFGRRVYEYIFVPVRGPGGEVEAVAGTTRDVTDRKAAEEEAARLLAEARDASRRKDEFLATLAHELRNPLAPLRNAVELFRLGPPPGEAARLLGMMDRQLVHLVRLVDDLLDVSRLTRGKVALRPERLDVREVAAAAVEAARPAVEARGHGLAVRLPDAPVWADGDRVRLVQVLTNLLANAAKFTPDGGRVEVAATREGADAVVRVSDTGVGIPADVLPRVFDPFTQVGRTPDRDQDGLGIGLALVKTLVELHGGAVTAESPGPGLGSTFSVRLPLAGPAGHPSTSGSAPEPEPRASG